MHSTRIVKRSLDHDSVTRTGSVVVPVNYRRSDGEDGRGEANGHRALRCLHALGLSRDVLPVENKIPNLAKGSNPLFAWQLPLSHMPHDVLAEHGHSTAGR